MMRNRASVVYKIDFGQGLRLGPGKVRLLELIDEKGSISGAARDMDMSYRRAWLLIGEFKQIFGVAAVEATAGGKRGGGARLTLFGRKVIKAFRSLETRADRMTHVTINELVKQAK
jgi:molybdate transport system regulatory protein